MWGWCEVGIISCEWKESISFYNYSSIKIKIEFFGDKSNQENHFTVNRPVNFIEKKPLAPSIHSRIYWFIYSTNICWVLTMSKAYCVHQLHFIHTVLWMSFGNRASKTRTGNSTTSNSHQCLWISNVPGITLESSLSRLLSPMWQEREHNVHFTDKVLRQFMFIMRPSNVYVVVLKRKTMVKVFISCSERCHYQSKINKERTWKKPKLRVSLFSKPKEHEN